MSAIGHSIAQAARSYRGTPFRHQGRQPGVALDCAGVVLCAAWAAGITVPDFAAYGKLPESDMLLGRLREACVQVLATEAIPGDLALFQFRAGLPTHLAVLTGDDRMVHAWEQKDRVLWATMGRSWAARTHSHWRFREAV